MPRDKSYKHFVSQFTLPEWKLLCKHRLFLHFLKSNLKMAASIAADALQRPIRYSFAEESGPPKRARTLKTSSGRSARFSLRHRRFRL